MKKVLLLGIGRWGANHLRVLHSLPIELFVVDSDTKRLDAAKKLGIPDSHVGTDHKLFRDKVDAVVVVTPAPSHFPLCREFLELDKDVFVEKPITLVSSEARELALLAEKRKRILQVGHIFRFDPASVWLKESIQRGDFGDVQILRSNFSGFKRPRNDSGVMFADAIHFVDLFHFILGKMPTKILAVLNDFMGRGMDDCSLLSLQFDREGGVTWGTVETNYFLPGKFREVVIVGTKLSAICDYNAAQYKIKTFQNKHVKEGNDFRAVEGTMTQVESPPEEPLLAELRGFLHAVETRGAVRADGWAGYASVRVLEAAMQSAKTGAFVEIPKEIHG